MYRDLETCILSKSTDYNYKPSQQATINIVYFTLQIALLGYMIMY